MCCVGSARVQHPRRVCVSPLRGVLHPPPSSSRVSLPPSLSLSLSLFRLPRPLVSDHMPILELPMAEVQYVWKRGEGGERSDERGKREEGRDANRVVSGWALQCVVCSVKAVRVYCECVREVCVCLYLCSWCMHVHAGMLSVFSKYTLLLLLQNSFLTMWGSPSSSDTGRTAPPASSRSSSRSSSPGLRRA